MRAFSEREPLGSDGASSIEVMLLSPTEDDDPSMRLVAPAQGQRWLAMVRSSAVQAGDSLRVDGGAGLALQVVGVVGDWLEHDEADGVEVVVSVECESNATLDEVLQQRGEVPIPPYMRRAADAGDDEAYNCTYASDDKRGSVAAPTAGLHFTRDHIERLERQGFHVVPLSLHVGSPPHLKLTLRMIYILFLRKGETLRANILESCVLC